MRIPYFEDSPLQINYSNNTLTSFQKFKLQNEKVQDGHKLFYAIETTYKQITGYKITVIPMYLYSSYIFGIFLKEMFLFHIKQLV